VLSIEFFEKNIEELKYDISLDMSQSLTKWLTAVIYDAYSEYPNSEEIILEKLTHSFSTVVQARRIISKSGDLHLDQIVADLSCLLHDIGRFKETSHNEHLTEVSGFDHATYGALIFEQYVFSDFPICENNKKVIAETIREHGKFEYTGNNLYVKLVRDADKLDNLINLDFQVENSSAVLKSKGVTKTVFDDFLAKKQIISSNIKSEADFIIFLSRWFFDINFVATTLLLKEAGVVNTIVQKLKNYEANDYEIGEIELKLNSVIDNAIDGSNSTKSIY